MEYFAGEGIHEAMFRSVCEICKVGILWHGAALGICAKRGITESGIIRGKR